MSSVAFLGPQNAPKSFVCWGFVPDPTGGAYSAPRPLVRFQGAYTEKVSTFKESAREGKREEGRQYDLCPGYQKLSRRMGGRMLY